MIKYTLLKQSLFCFVIISVYVLVANKNVQADIIMKGPKPLKYIEYVRFYPPGSGPIYGQDDDLGEKLPFEETYTYHDQFYNFGYVVTQEGYVLTTLAPFPKFWIFTKSVPLIEIQLTTTISAFGGGWGEVRGLPWAKGIIYFYGEVINTSNSGETRLVPLEMKAEANVDMTVTGSGMGLSECAFELRKLNPDYSYTGFIHLTSNEHFCDSVNSETWTCTPGYHSEPGVKKIGFSWFFSVAPGVTQPFEVRMIADCSPHLVASNTPGGGLPTSSSLTCKVKLDPFVYIDPEWEYADEYTLKLSPGMYVGPPPAKSKFPWPMFLPAIIKNAHSK